MNHTILENLFGAV